MRYFAGLNLQDVWVFLIPALVFIMVFALGLGFSHIRNRDSGKRKQTVIRDFPDGISERNAPFPLIMTLIIAGTILWAILYILLNGLPGVKI
ncbi:MAG: hypothetical protein KKF30_18380 [Proteobacteria bacterium]|nr:hypothetical protein [Pseudomonadota bacterium]MBU4469785.1 hypothetical protein [Pseudomonadota bacterium]MCG2753020.1 hypothetical protein [Desulfobacteraceae bacterium]